MRGKLLLLHSNHRKDHRRRALSFPAPSISNYLIKYSPRKISFNPHPIYRSTYHHSSPSTRAMLTIGMYRPALNDRPSSPPIYRAPPRRSISGMHSNATRYKPSLKKRCSQLFSAARQNDDRVGRAPSSRSSKTRLAKLRRRASRYLDRLFSTRGMRSLFWSTWHSFLSER